MKKNFFILVLIAVIIIGIFTILTKQKNEYRTKEVAKFKKFYVPKKIKECLGKHGYSLENPSAKEKKACEDYVKQIWEEQRILNNVEA